MEIQEMLDLPWSVMLNRDLRFPQPFCVTLRLLCTQQIAAKNTFVKALSIPTACKCYCKANERSLCKPVLQLEHDTCNCMKQKRHVVSSSKVRSQGQTTTDIRLENPAVKFQRNPSLLQSTCPPCANPPRQLCFTILHLTSESLPATPTEKVG
jgi:hypothetical protein